MEHIKRINVQQTKSTYAYNNTTEKTYYEQKYTVKSQCICWLFIRFTNLIK